MSHPESDLSDPPYQFNNGAINPAGDGRYLRVAGTLFRRPFAYTTVVHEHNIVGAVRAAVYLADERGNWRGAPASTFLPVKRSLCIICKSKCADGDRLKSFSLITELLFFCFLSLPHGT